MNRLVIELLFNTLLPNPFNPKIVLKVIVISGSSSTIRFFSSYEVVGWNVYHILHQFFLSFLIPCSAYFCISNSQNPSSSEDLIRCSSNW